MKLLISIIAFISILAIANAELGIDVSSATSQKMTSSQWSCLAQKNQRAIIQVWSGGYGMNNGVVSAIQAAQNAGFQTVDLYAFLCNQCSGNSPSSNVIQQIVSKIKQSGVSFGTLWIDVEQCSGCWGSTSANAAFVVEAVQTAASLGVRVGVYSSSGEWPQTVGTLTSLSSYPQWYAHYDGVPAFSDSGAYQYGGWNNPEMKQYVGNTNQCGVSVDLDFYGSSSSSSSASSTTHTSSSSGPSSSGPSSSGPSHSSSSSGPHTSSSSGPHSSGPSSSGPHSSSSSGPGTSSESSTSSNPTSSNPTSSNPTSSNPTSSNPTSSNPTSSNPTSSNPTSSNPTSSYTVSSSSGLGWEPSRKLRIY
ncbi:glycoside hydrolase family 25 protein [Heterostelium album PN500]|uniref:Glycoside hydrolase family 25 protein n=1 Tax=Heterostelium pallidum (strain ATCC 26659 / Pp 5 / PN500) TaxID=670386 RepID=D3BQX3_HETP5|nr:glycoside hydrolase family 25 protein [Heterostelium album PN500]EFA76159.1 glycoside hydrolase family 25 protein [Heterostelium album PN500]|eukprot:XP_020428293.1 glycoside hydrolase family 25 protein [Heterostelium album PN500]